MTLARRFAGGLPFRLPGQKHNRRRSGFVTNQDIPINDVVERIEYRGHTILIHPDEMCDDPTNNDGWMSTFYHWHKRYTFADCAKCVRTGHVNSAAAEPMIIELQKDLDAGRAVAIPVAMMDHSGVSLWEGTGPHPLDAQGWDSGPVGFLWTDRARIKQHLGISRLTTTTRERVLEALRQELKVLAAWVTGECYGYSIETKDGQELENECWGYVGDTEYLIADAKAAVDAQIKRDEEAAAVARKNEEEQRS